MTVRSHTPGRAASSTPATSSDANPHQGNLLVGKGPLKAVEKAFVGTPWSLPRRVVAALVAGKAAGGGKRGHSSCVAIIVSKRAGGREGKSLLDPFEENNPGPVDAVHRRFLGECVQGIEPDEWLLERGIAGPGLQQLVADLKAHRMMPAGVWDESESDPDSDSLRLRGVQGDSRTGGAAGAQRSGAAENGQDGQSCGSGTGAATATGNIDQGRREAQPPLYNFHARAAEPPFFRPSLPPARSAAEKHGLPPEPPRAKGDPRPRVHYC